MKCLNFQPPLQLGQSWNPILANEIKSEMPGEIF